MTTRKIFFYDDCNEDEELDIDLMHLKFLVSVKEKKLEQITAELGRDV